MKSRTSKLKFLAVAGIAFLAMIAIHSCSKSSSTPAAAGPKVTSVTTGGTDTAGSSTTLTITGSNLTGANVTTTTSGVTITNVSVASGGTSLTATIKVTAATASGSVTLTITTSAGSTTTTVTIVGLTPLGGFLSSDSVEAASLISYFPFNGSVNDTVGSETGTAVGVTYTTGIRGQAYQGAAGAYATVPANSKFGTLTSYSVSVWYNLPSAVKPGTTGPAQGMFFLSGDSTGSSGNYLILETDVPSASQLAADSVPIHHGFDNLGGVAGSWQNFTMNSFDTATSNWVHVVMTYDGPSSTYVFYENGQPIAVSSAYGVSTSTTLYDGPLPVGSGTPPTQLMGNLNFSPAVSPASTLYIGAWPPGLYGVSPTLGANGDFQGALDELRVYSIALKPTDVVGLYLNGLAGR
jgi:hypothetical protein